MSAQEHEQQAAPSQPSSRAAGGLGVRERAVTAPRPKMKWTGVLLGLAVGVPLMLRDADRQFALIAVLVLVVLLGGVLVLAFVKRPQQECVALHARGLTFQQGSGPVVSARWDTVQTVERGIAVHRSNGAVARRTPGMTIGLATRDIELSTRFPDSEQLFARIDQQVLAQQMPRAIEALAGGEHVSFASSWERELGREGIAGISAAGLRVQEQVFDWDQIRGVATREGEVTVTTAQGREVTVPAYGFPNLSLFVALVTHFVGGRGND